MERRIKSARFLAPKSLEEFYFLVTQGLYKNQILELARFNWIDSEKTLTLIGNPGVDKTHLAVDLERTACKRGYGVLFFIAVD
jgi:DNA replication protein DnaC